MIYGGDKFGNPPQHYNRYYITCLNDVDLPKVLDDICTNINGVIQIYVDCFMSTLGDLSQMDEITNEPTKIETCRIMYPNQVSHINDTTEILQREDIDKLRSECRFDAFTAKLHNNLQNDPFFKVSNVRFNRVLAYSINVNSFPPGWIYK